MRGLIGCVVALAACSGPGIRISQPAPTPPLLSPRPGTAPPAVPALIGGFLYPGTGATVGAFELDVPVFTAAGTPYFAFEANFRVAGLRTLALTWSRAGAAAIAIPIVDGPCDLVGAPAMDQALRFSRVSSVRATGREASVSISPSMDLRLDSGEALAYVTCTNGTRGELVAGGGADFNLAVMLPTSVLGTGGTLGIMAVNVADQVRSTATEMTIVKTPQMVAAVGDSMVWGQGVPRSSTAAELLRARVAAAVGPTIPAVTMVAHSGAALGTSPMIRGTTCTAPALNGEIPSGTPTIPCQILSISSLTCAVESSDLGTVAIPRITCPGDPPVPGGTPLAMPAFDTGPRWDFVLMDGCINDIGGGNLVRGAPGMVTPADVTSAVAGSCDLTRSIPDLRQVLPNAVIPYHGYHLIVDRSSDPAATGCPLPPPPPPPPYPPPPPDPIMVGLGTGAAIVATIVVVLAYESMLARTARFQTASDTMLASSIARLNPSDGVGTVVFVPLSPTFSPGTAFLSPGSLVWPLICAPGMPPLSPIDPVATARASACATTLNPSGGPPPIDQHNCDRASAFHPTVAGAAAIDALVGAAIASRLRPAP